MTALFTVFLFLRRIMIPSPEFTNKPATSAPKDKLPPINNSLRKTLLAQFGIKPTMEPNKGDRYLFVTTKLEKLSSPTAATISPKETLITKTYHAAGHLQVRQAGRPDTDRSFAAICRLQQSGSRLCRRGRGGRVLPVRPVKLDHLDLLGSADRLLGADPGCSAWTARLSRSERHPENGHAWTSDRRRSGHMRL